tara:strand:- start:102 stop:2810 length:2709 start_codon:yes stop_codon:yes gene_type:complete
MFRIPKRFSKKIIKIPNNFATIIHANDDYCWYELTYVIDIVKIITIAKGYRVKITADPSYHIPQPTRLSVFGDLHNATSLNADTVRDSILRSPTSMKEAVGNNKTDPSKLTVAYSDASAGLDNETAGKIAANPARASKYLATEMRLVGVSNVANPARLRQSPVLSISMLPATEDSLEPVGPSRHLAIKSLLTDGVDPSLIANSRSPIITPHQAVQGLSSSPVMSPIANPGINAANPKGYGRYSVSRKRKPAFISKTSRPGPAAKKLRKRMNRGRIRRAKVLAHLQSRMQVIAQRVPVRFRTIKKRIRIPNAKIGSADRMSFKFELQYRGLSGVTVSFRRTVNHAELLNEYQIPDIPPTITARGVRIGINLLSVKQNDPKATHIKIYRKIINTGNPKWAPWRILKTIEADYKDSALPLVDQVNNTQCCAYRVRAVGVAGQKGHGFDSVVVPPLKIPVPKVPIDRTKLAYVSIFAADSSNDEAVRITVTNIPPGPCAIYVLASDLTAKCPARAHLGHCRIVGDLGRQTKKVGLNTAELIFYDNDVKHDHTYEYTCVMIYPDGKEVKSPSPIVHAYRKVQTTNITLQVGQPTLSEDPNMLGQYIAGTVDVAVNIPVTADFTDAGLNQVTDSLFSAGIESDFVDEIKDNKQEFQKLLRCEVQRQDVTSGETETFGVQEIGVFIDNSVTRAIAGVSELQLGRRYMYTVRLLQRSPLGLLEGGSFQTVDTVTKRKYELRVGKFLNPLTLQKGTLPSTRRALGRSKVSGLVPEDPFLQGVTGIEEEVEIVIPKSDAAKIGEVQAAKNSSGNNAVRWTIHGSKDEFDHFIVYAQYQGVKYVAGKVDNDGSESSNTYTFVDYQLGDAPGSVEYSVMPVHEDYRYGMESVAPVLDVKHPSYDVNFWANREKS